MDMSIAIIEIIAIREIYIVPNSSAEPMQMKSSMTVHL